MIMFFSDFPSFCKSGTGQFNRQNIFTGKISRIDNDPVVTPVGVQGPKISGIDLFTVKHYGKVFSLKRMRFYISQAPGQIVDDWICAGSAVI